VVLPEDGPCRIGGVELPVGRRLRDQDGERPRIWATSTAVASPGAVWDQLRPGAHGVGLVPVLLDHLRGEPSRPWDEEEFGPPDDGDAADYDEAEVFREGWLKQVPLGSIHPLDRDWLRARGEDADDDYEEDDEETGMFLAEVAPWGVRFPGLALAERQAADQPERQRALQAANPARVALVAADRAADVPYVLGWWGATNHFIGEDDKALKLSVMMRTWEDRFGAYLLRLGFDEMEFIVERPPHSEALALAVAAEHYAFAGSDGFQAYDGEVGTLGELAAKIRDGLTWRFWWD